MTAEAPQSAFAEVERYVASRREVRVRDVEEHLRAVGFRRSPGIAVARTLTELGFERRVRACGAIYVAPSAQAARP
jgi:hypothetical protein